MDQFLRSEIGAKATFRDDVIGQSQRDSVCKDGTVPVGNIRKRARVNDGGCSLSGLDEVWANRFFQQRGHRSGATEFFDADRIPLRC